MNFLKSKWLQLLLIVCLTIGIVRAIVYTVILVVILDIFIELVSFSEVNLFNSLTTGPAIALFLVYIAQALMVTGIVAIAAYAIKSVVNWYRNRQY